MWWANNMQIHKLSTCDSLFIVFPILKLWNYWNVKDWVFFFRKFFSYFKNGKSKHCLYENVFDRVFDEISNNMHVSKLFVCGSLVIDL